MNLKVEIIRVKKPVESDGDEDTASQEPADGLAVQSNLETHPSYQSVSTQIDAWMEKNNSEEAAEEETKYIKTQLLWYFFLKRQQLLKMWLRTTAQARSK